MKTKKSTNFEATDIEKSLDDITRCRFYNDTDRPFEAKLFF